MTYCTLKQVVESSKYPFSMGQVRHFLLHRHKNGLDKAVRKIGKRVYLNGEMFEQWIESKSGAQS
jgi:hypothetical protein